MEPNKSLFIITKSEAVKTKIILHNVLTMLSNRIYIDKQGNKHAVLDNVDDKNVTEKSDNTFIIKANNGATYAVKIIYQKITATGKQSVIREFFKDYAQYHKIIIANDFNNKIAEYVSKRHTQIFRESALLMDIISHRDQPKFEVLTPKEIEQVMAEYHVSDYTMKKMLRTDAVCKYYALKRGDVIRIIRPSPTAGQAIDYRIVI